MMASTLLTETKVRIQALDSVNSLRLHRNRKWVVSLQSPGKSGEIPQSSPPALDAALAYPMPLGPHGQTPPSSSSLHTPLLTPLFLASLPFPCTFHPTKPLQGGDNIISVREAPFLSWNFFLCHLGETA